MRKERNKDNYKNKKLNNNNKQNKRECNNLKWSKRKYNKTFKSITKKKRLNLSIKIIKLKIFIKIIYLMHLKVNKAQLLILWPIVNQIKNTNNNL